eukprot:COSAG01_NODE_6129_length_3835_cov_2.876907_4_plen_159_part_00
MPASCEGEHFKHNQCNQRTVAALHHRNNAPRPTDTNTPHHACCVWVDRVVTPSELATASVETFACVSASTSRREISASVPAVTAASVCVASRQRFHAHHVWQGEAQQTDSAGWLWQAAAEDADVVAPFGFRICLGDYTTELYATSAASACEWTQGLSR